MTIYAICQNISREINRQILLVANLWFQTPGWSIPFPTPHSPLIVSVAKFPFPISFLPFAWALSLCPHLRPRVNFLLQQTIRQVCLSVKPPRREQFLLPFVRKKSDFHMARISFSVLLLLLLLLLLHICILFWAIVCLMNGCSCFSLYLPKQQRQRILQGGSKWPHSHTHIYSWSSSFLIVILSLTSNACKNWNHDDRYVTTRLSLYSSEPKCYLQARILDSCLVEDSYTACVNMLNQMSAGRRLSLLH